MNLVGDLKKKEILTQNSRDNFPEFEVLLVFIALACAYLPQIVSRKTHIVAGRCLTDEKVGEQKDCMSFHRMS